MVQFGSLPFSDGGCYSHPVLLHRCESTRGLQYGEGVCLGASGRDGAGLSTQLMY